MFRGVIFVFEKMVKFEKPFASLAFFTHDLVVEYINNLSVISYSFLYKCEDLTILDLSFILYVLVDS